MRLLGLISIAVLTGCGPSGNEVDVADVNARDALDQVSALRSRVDELEFQVEDLTDQVATERVNRETEDAAQASDLADHTHY